MKTFCDPPNTAGPLTWNEARALLRSVLEQYLNDRSLNSSIQINENRPAFEGYCSKWITYNLDLYVGVTLISIMLLSMTICSLVASKYVLFYRHWQPLASIYVYKSQVAAATLLLSSSILSIWMAHRRRFLCLNDSNTSKRREIKKFLKSNDAEKNVGSKDGSVTDNSKIPKEVASLLAGTSQTDIYPVYRKTVNSDGEISASWSHIPSLLMVRGDFIALQIGDVVPASCVSIEQRDTFGNAIEVKIGERISISTFAKNRGNISDRLPKGRTTIPPDSDSFLTLCNQMQIFQVIETPIEEFIRRPYGKSKIHRFLLL
jgi:hypothetical protein